MKRQPRENLKNKYSDSSLFRLPSHKSQPRPLETKSGIQQRMVQPWSGALTVRAGVVRVVAWLGTTTCVALTSWREVRNPQTGHLGVRPVLYSAPEQRDGWLAGWLQSLV